MTRLLILVVVAVALWLLLEWGYRKLMSGFGLDPRTGRRVRGARGAGSASAGESLVRCDACGAYVPASRALPSRAGRRLCSEACRSRLRP